MTWWALVVSPWALSFVAGRSALRLARRARPEAALRVLLISGAVLAAATTGSIALIAFVGVARIGAVAAFAHWTGAVPRGHVVPPLWCTLATLVAVGLLARRVVRSARAIAGTTVRAAVLQRGAATPIVAVHDHQPYAYACRAVPYRPGVIFISDGLRNALDPEELASVIAHEHAHVERQHCLYHHAATLVASMNPFLAQLGQAVDYCLERAADEDAATTAGRATTATALARAALHRVTIVSTVGLAHARNDIAWRIEALLDDRPRRATRVLLLAGLAALAVATLLVAAHDTEMLIESIRR
jgi:hypothetical protein